MIDSMLEAPELTTTVSISRPALHPRRWLGLSAILAATLMNLLDSTVRNVAAEFQY